MVSTTCQLDCGTSSAVVELAFRDDRLHTERDDAAFCTAAVTDPVLALVAASTTPGEIRCAFSVVRNPSVLNR